MEVGSNLNRVVPIATVLALPGYSEMLLKLRLVTILYMYLGAQVRPVLPYLYICCAMVNS